jgi:hypothetical protein
VLALLIPHIINLCIMANSLTNRGGGRLGAPAASPARTHAPPRRPILLNLSCGCPRPLPPLSPKDPSYIPYPRSPSHIAPLNPAGAPAFWLETHALSHDMRQNGRVFTTPRERRPRPPPRAPFFGHVAFSQYTYSCHNTNNQNSTLRQTARGDFDVPTTAPAQIEPCSVCCRSHTDRGAVDPLRLHSYCRSRFFPSPKKTVLVRPKPFLALRLSSQNLRPPMHICFVRFNLPAASCTPNIASRINLRHIPDTHAHHKGNPTQTLSRQNTRAHVWWCSVWRFP